MAALTSPGLWQIPETLWAPILAPTTAWTPVRPRAVAPDSPGAAAAAGTATATAAGGSTTVPSSPAFTRYPARP